MGIFNIFSLVFLVMFVWAIISPYDSLFWYDGERTRIGALFCYGFPTWLCYWLGSL